MQPSPTTNASRDILIGRLCFGGDWACAHGDASALRDIVQQLAERMPEPLHCELIALAERCCDEPDRAAGSWPVLKELVFRAT